VPVSLEAFGTALRRLRELSGLTQEQLAERAGLSPRAVRALELGERRHPHPHTIRVLTAALGLSAEGQEQLASTLSSRRRSRIQAEATPPEPTAGIPPDPIPHFVGRGDELMELREQLVLRKRVVVDGLSGVGKTQLAIRYLDEHAGDYPNGQYWLRAEQSSTLLSDLASLAWRLELPERELPKQELQIEAVLRWLRQHEGWLLVVDGVGQEGVEDAVRWLPQRLPGHVLMTSLTPHGSSRLSLRPLPSELAVRFLLERTGQSDSNAAQAIADTVGNLPLALEQAAAYLVENPPRTLAGYAELLRTRMAELLRDGGPNDHLPVATTWDLSFRRIEQSRPPAADLLRLCAFMAGDDIPISLLQSAREELPRPLSEALADEIEWDHTLAALRSYSLVEVQGDGVRVHQLVQWAIRESLSAEQERRWEAATIRFLAEGFPSAWKRPGTWPLCARLLPHSEAVIGRLGAAGLEREAMSLLMTRVASYLFQRGAYSLARPLNERALAIREMVLGPDHPGTADSLNAMAVILAQQGEPAAAQPFYERALAIREKELGPEHPDTAAVLLNLAYLLGQQGELAAARPLSERALAISEKVLGPEHPTTATSLRMLALLLYDQGEQAAAWSLFERALAIRERVLGPDHPDTASSLNNLANLLRDRGDFAAARPLYERALAIREKMLGPEHASTARSLYYLANLLADQGDLATAVPLYERALAIHEKALGPEHHTTAEDRRALELVRLERPPGGAEAFTPRNSSW
jgi:tetratricopeptide (TPR) repeat protein/DNA-binding XRE family transcriptional regulator